jgi:hypothetical protein
MSNWIQCSWVQFRITTSHVTTCNGFAVRDLTQWRSNSTRGACEIRFFVDRFSWSMSVGDEGNEKIEFNGVAMFGVQKGEKKWMWGGRMVVCRREWLEMALQSRWWRSGWGGDERRQRLLNYSDRPVTSSFVPAANHWFTHPIPSQPIPISHPLQFKPPFTH